MKSTDPKILIISRVLPFPGKSGQQMRIQYMLRSLKKDFHVTFFTTTKRSELKYINDQLKKYVDVPIVIPTRYEGFILKSFYKVFGLIWTLFSGLKESNFIVGKVDITTNRIKKELGNKKIDIVIYEYWHAYETINYFKSRGIPTILDMHNVLWQSYKIQIKSNNWLPRKVKELIVDRYKDKEQNIWKEFNGLIAINQKELEYVRTILDNQSNLTLIPMGIDLAKWHVKRKISKPNRIGFYGGLASLHNQKSVMKCFYNIMPKVWEKLPEIEFWIIGSQPPKKIIKLQDYDERVVVTGFVEKVQDVLKTMSLMIIPWEGTYGFRSRIVEMIAIGLPVITSYDAIDGMNISKKNRIYCTNIIEDYPKIVFRILKPEKQNMKKASKNLNHKFFQKFDASYTYKKLNGFLKSFLN